MNLSFIDEGLLGLFVVIYSYLLSLSVATIWMENNYYLNADRDNSEWFKMKQLNKFQYYYFTFLIFILLLPVTGFFILFIKFEFFSKIIYCSNHDSADRIPSASQNGGVSTAQESVPEEDLLNHSCGVGTDNYLHSVSRSAQRELQMLLESYSIKENKGSEYFNPILEGDGSSVIKNILKKMSDISQISPVAFKSGVINDYIKWLKIMDIDSSSEDESSVKDTNPYGRRDPQISASKIEELENWVLNELELEDIEKKTDIRYESV